MKQNRKSVHNAPARKGLDYTPRQLAILNDELPLEEIKTMELVKLMKRALEREDEVNFDIAKSLHEAKTNPNNYRPIISLIEAKMILQRLTPWMIDWTPRKKK